LGSHLVYIFRYNDLISTIVGNYLISSVTSPLLLIAERRPGYTEFVRMKVRLFGFWKAMDQMAFILLNKIFMWVYGQREIVRAIEEEDLIDFMKPLKPDHIVSSVRSPELLRLIPREGVEGIVINGTRILPKDFLACVDAPILNIHLGITPWYRGVHGGYWSLVNQDGKNFGATLHVVNSSVDSGGIISQGFCSPREYDNINIYPIRQIAPMLPHLSCAINKLREGRNLIVSSPKEQGRQYSHPGVTDYLLNLMSRGIK